MGEGGTEQNDEDGADVRERVSDGAGQAEQTPARAAGRRVCPSLHRSRRLRGFLPRLRHAPVYGHGSLILGADAASDRLLACSLARADAFPRACPGRRNSIATPLVRGAARPGEPRPTVARARRVDGSFTLLLQLAVRCSARGRPRACRAPGAVERVRGDRCPQSGTAGLVQPDTCSAPTRRSVARLCALILQASEGRRSLTPARELARLAARVPPVRDRASERAQTPRPCLRAASVPSRLA